MSQMDLFGEAKAHQEDLEAKRRASSGVITQKTILPAELDGSSVLWTECIPNEREQEWLEELRRRGIWSKASADHYGHRGQAKARELRLMGWRISNTVTESGPAYQYEGEPTHRLVKVRDRLKQMYYQTSHWQRKAFERKQYDNFQCRQCLQDGGELETHHWVYNLFSEDVMFELTTFCRDCHARIHDAIGGSSVHFPYVLPIDVAQRIADEGGRR